MCSQTGNVTVIVSFSSVIKFCSFGSFPDYITIPVYGLLVEFYLYTNANAAI